MHADEFKRIFHTKINTLTPAFMPVNFGKKSQTLLIFNALRPKTLEKTDTKLAKTIGAG
jgi:hypothetical protein